MNVFVALDSLGSEGFVIYGIFETLEKAVEALKGDKYYGVVIEEIPMNKMFDALTINKTACIEGCVADYDQEGNKKNVTKASRKFK